MPHRILLADDDAILRELYEEILLGAGFHVDTAENGVLALERLKQGGYSVSLLDFLMPEMNGLTVLSELSQYTVQEKNGPIIFITNVEQESILIKARTLGASACLIKVNITPDKLLAEINKHLE